MGNERDFKGVWIPKVVWLDTRLNALDKIILTEIDSLDNSEEGCFASNQYLAEFCQCSPSKVSSSISNLINYNYLYVKKFDGRIRYLKSRLSKNENQTSKICKADYQNLEEININNNTINNTTNKKKERKSTTSYDEIINSKINNQEIKDLLYEFIKMRTLKKKPMTDRALTIQINKLLRLSSNEEEQKEIIEKSIVKCWDEFYSLKREANNEINRSSTKRDGSEYAEYD